MDGYIFKCDSCDKVTTAVTIVSKVQWRDFEAETYEGCEHCGADCDHFFTTVPACGMCKAVEVPEPGNLCDDCEEEWQDMLRDAQEEHAQKEETL